MSRAMMLVNLDCLVLIVLSAALLWIKKYQEGILGHIGLGCIIFAAVLILSEQWGGLRYEIARELVVLITGLTFFMCHHFYRYLRYYHFHPTEKAAGEAGAMHKEG
jgi:fatty acid desaturase